MKTRTVKLPAFLASALVNGDASGLTCSCGAMPENAGGRDRRADPTHVAGCDFEVLAAAVAYCRPGYIASVEGDLRYARCNDLPGDLGSTPSDVLDYVVLYP